MVFFVDFFELGVCYVGVYLGCGDGFVAEHGLDRTDVGAGAEEVGCEGVAEGVRRDSLCDSGGFGGVFYYALDGSWRKWSDFASVLLCSVVGNEDMGSDVFSGF